jgi:hypothetical protein
MNEIYGEGPIGIDEPYYVKGKLVGEKFRKSAHLLMLSIHGLCQAKKGACIATTKFLAKSLNKSVRQVTYYLKFLKDTGQIHVKTSDPIRNKDFSKGRGLFYKKRIVQSMHDHKPDGYDEFNKIKFNEPKRTHKKSFKALIASLSPKIRIHSKLVDYKGKLLGPERVGRMTTEFFAQQLELMYPKPTEEQELAAYIASRPPAKEPEEIDLEPEDGNELSDLRERMRRSRIKESEVFWENIDKEEEYEEPLEFTIKLNIINPYTKKPL